MWTDYKIQTVEDQQKFAVPLNRDTETLFYNVRMLIDAKVETEPRAWLISKVNRVTPNGVCRVTLAQDTFDPEHDYIEHDDYGNIVGMWANYFSSNLPLEEVTYDEPATDTTDDSGDDSGEETTPTFTTTISCSGKRQIKIGGSAKTLTVTFYDEDGNVTDYQSGTWSFMIDDVDAADLLTLSTVADGKIKVKFDGDDSYINKILTVTFTSGEVSSFLDLELLPL